MGIKHSALSMAILLLLAPALHAGRTPRPVVPHASKEAKALLNYIHCVSGNMVLSGQHGMTEADYVFDVTGRYPAIKGYDLIRESDNAKVVESAIDWWKRGGIPTVMWHWGAPGKGEGYDNSKKAIDIDRCFQEGTEEYTAMWADLERIADWLTVLRDAHVPVLWRPMHECDGDWFWYGKGSGEQFCRVWRTMFDYFSKERKLDNLIWVLCHCGQPLGEFDPGEGYYDIVGSDSYNKERVRQEMYDKLLSIHGSSRPVTYHECGTIPDPDLCKEAGVDWVWWMLWSGDYTKNYDKDDLMRIYRHERIITLDELPDIMQFSRVRKNMPIIRQETSGNSAKGFPHVYNSRRPGAFPLLKGGSAASIWTDASDFPVVGISAGFLADDIERIGNVRPNACTASSISGIRGRNVVIAGTVGHSALIDSLAAEGRIDVSGISGKWESFVIKTVRRPFPGTDKALVIAGSDRRGTAFGLTSLCEAAGVSPWYFWADVTPRSESALYVQKGTFSQGEPSVKYRGFFINDERFGGWARWSEECFETETHKVGPKTYSKVFELLLRLKANYLWPAMHPGTQAFNGDPENARLADDYAIVMGTSHCEQMLRNNEDEWKKPGTFGDFNYITNRETMIKYWEDRIKTNGAYENTYTIGLRGIHDYPMEGASTNEERVGLMQQAINDQRDILKRNIDKDISGIPQVLCTYEEVLEAYQEGLQVPDDVTLLWSDDKQGYLRNLCNPEERKRAGGAGVYYHISYHGDPDSWFWLSPLSPSLISTEMCKSYDYGADRIWVFNVGDIKPAEKELSFAMELAWDIDRWRPEKASGYIEYWFAKTFGRKNAKEMAALQDRYYRLMSYGKEFHTRWLEYTPEEIEWRLQEWKEISNETERIGALVEERLKPAFFETFEYPMMGARLTNEYVLEARKSMVYAGNGGGDALAAAARSEAATAKVDSLTNYYNNVLLDGKWAHFFNWRPYKYLDGNKAIMELADSSLVATVAAAPSPQFILNDPAVNTGYMDLSFESVKAGTLPLWIHARTPIINNSFRPQDNRFCTVSINGIEFEASAEPHGNIWHTDFVGPMWSRVGEIPITEGKNTLILKDIDNNASICKVFIGYQPPFDIEPTSRIAAADYKAVKNPAEGRFTTIDGLGYNDGVTIIPSMTPSYEASDAPWLEYVIPVHEGPNRIELRTLPTLRAYAGRDARYAVSIDEGEPEIFDIHEPDYSSEWRWNVLRGYARRSIYYDADKAGTHSLKVSFLDPGIVMQEICIY